LSGVLAAWPRYRPANANCVETTSLWNHTVRAHPVLAGES
jgi:hypothetical protein